MILYVRNAICLSLVVLAATACDAMQEDTAGNNQHQWFNYAYYSSNATLEADGLSKEVLDYNTARMRVY